MDYKDFTIDLRSIEGGGFEAEVAAAPLEDNARVAFAAPLTPEELTALLASFDAPDPKAPPPPPPPLNREVGEKLFRALFEGEVGELFERCRLALTHAGDTGLRLRLRMRDDDGQHDYLSALPWEWLWDPAAEQFLATDLATPVVRNLAIARAPDPLGVAAPLHVLVVEATPCGLDVRKEIDRMDRALGLLQDAGQVKLFGLNHATPDDLRQALRDEEIHVLHFIGHGGYDATTGKGAIFLGRDGGGEEQVDGERLAPFLKGIRSLRLVVLNACKTARHAGAQAAPLASGVAAALLRHTRVPAVVATLGSISDETAVRWSEIFYQRLASGDGVDEAITETRLALSRQRRDWGLPALFLSGADGKLFDFEPAKRRRVVRLLGRSRPEGEPVRLSVRSFQDGFGGAIDDASEGVLDLSRHFTPPGPEKRPVIKSPELWDKEVFPELRNFLRARVEEGRPLKLHFAAHVSIAFAAGWLLEPKSGLEVRIPQRSRDGETQLWHSRDGSEAGGALWLPRPDRVLDPAGPDRALALAVTWADVAAQAEEHIRRTGLPVGRLLEAIVPEPGHRAVQGGAHALRLAETLLPRLLAREPHERGGRLHIYSSAPNSLVFYLGQLLSPLGRLVLYEYPFKVPGVDTFGRYLKSIELPPPGEERPLPEWW